MNASPIAKTTSFSYSSGTKPIDVAIILNDHAEKLCDVATQTSNTPNPETALPNEDLIGLAEEKLRRRRLRYRHLPQHLFGEPAWTMLLDLFVAQNRHRTIATTNACLASHVPATTALRWLEILERCDLVKRCTTDADKRVEYLSLTKQGEAAVRSILESYTK